MAGPLSDKHFQVGMIRDEDYKAADNLFTGSQEYRSIWYRSRKEIENNSPSRKDGIDLRKEMHLRTVYCSFLQDLGMKLGVPQVTIATAMLFCHRFYLHQSHAKNDWQSLQLNMCHLQTSSFVSPTIATVSMFLASKVEDTPCLLDKVVIVAYEMIYRRERAAAQRIHCKDVFEKQKTLIIIGERLLLSTIGFDFNIQHPYKPLVAAVKKLGITQKEVMRVAWNFVNDWFRTSLCLQYKPHYIAAGSIFLASKLHNVKLPSERGHVWWHEFDVTPQQLEEVIQEMMELLGYKTRAMLHPAHEKPNQTQLPTKEEASSSPESCVLSRPASSNNTSHELDGKVSHNPDSENVCVSGRVELQCQVKDSESPNSVLDVGEISGKGEDQERINPDVTERCSGIDRVRIKAMLMKRKVEREMNKKMIDMDDTNEDAWIERELETGIDLGAEPAEKKQRLSRG